MHMNNVEHRQLEDTIFRAMCRADEEIKKKELIEQEEIATREWKAYAAVAQGYLRNEVLDSHEGKWWRKARKWWQAS